MIETMAAADASAVKPPTISADASGTEPLQTQDGKREPILDLKSVRLFHDPPGTLRVTVDRNGRDGWESYSYPVARIYQAAPLSMPGRFIVLQDGKGEEIVMADRLGDLSEESVPVAEEELRRRYLTARITAIPHIKQEFGVTYWDVLTDRGKRDFVVQSMSESCMWLSDNHILITDVDGNRFEIVDREALDPHSQEQLVQVM
ncbi:MAG: DUF1854 domain-containing protein [Capsulimonadales bacterium]|nr:DUF1854 domain-containing protein [Capsulimonadales bacterium]